MTTASLPRLGARVVGPAAPEGTDLDDPEYVRWDTIRSAVVAIGKRMGTFVGGDEEDRATKTTKADRLAAPQVVADDEDQELFGGKTDFVDDVVEPPFDFATLCAIFENSSALRQNVDAIKTNVDGFGHRFDPVIDFSDPDVNNVVRDIMLREKLDGDGDAYDDLMKVDPAALDELEPPVEEVEKKRKFWERIAAIERGRVRSFFDFINPIDSFVEIRKASREDREIMGNAGWEVVREREGDVESRISQVYRVPFANMKLIRADSQPTTVRMKVRKDDVNFDTVEVDRFFRRYVRITMTSRTYYKQFGDPRVVSRSSGRYYDSIEALREAEPGALQANEFYHWRVRSPISAYGIPRWLSALLAVLGSRAAEEVNFLYFDNKAIPPMVLLVSGGRVSESSVEKIENHIEERIKGRKNFHKIMILEALPADADVSEGNLEHAGKMRLELKPLLGDIQQDALFQKYDGNNVTKVGRVFRVPQLLTGDTKDMNRSTADVAKAFAEEQVFQPERDEFDAVMNRHFLPSINIHFWRYRSSAPVQRIPNDLVENATKALDAGAIVPDEARQLLSDAFSIDFRRVDREWSRVPPKLALAAARMGAMAEAEGANSEASTAAAQVADQGESVLVARGKTVDRSGEGDEHEHSFVAVRDDDGRVRIFVLPGGADGHTHDVEPVDVSEGSSVDARTKAHEDGHDHAVRFQVALSKRRKRARADARAILALRDAIREELEATKDEWLDEIDRSGGDDE